jgi:hypothetical protein
LQRAYHAAKRRAGITRPGGIHGLRHAFATHLLEGGVDVHTIQRLLGHGDITTTTRYFHLTKHAQIGPNSALDLLARSEPPPKARLACAVPLSTAVSSRPRLELADLVRAHGDAYRRTHRLAPVQHRALHAIETCRTAVLGGHRETCDRCGAARITYNSCRTPPWSHVSNVDQGAVARGPPEVA